MVWLTLADELRTVSFDYDEYKMSEITSVLDFGGLRLVS